MLPVEHAGHSGEQKGPLTRLLPCGVWLNRRRRPGCGVDRASLFVNHVVLMLGLWGLADLRGSAPPSP